MPNARSSDTSNYESLRQQRRDQMSAIVWNTDFRWWKQTSGPVITEPAHTEFWYGNPPFYVSILNPAPGTLAGDLLTLSRDIPSAFYDQNVEINGDVVKILGSEEVKPLPDWEAMDSVRDDILPGPELTQLPIVTVDDTLHFVKTCRSKYEILNLLKCRGCPHVVQLLGRTEDGQLVFEKHPSDLMKVMALTAVDVKRRLLQVIDVMEALHTRGIVHRDVVARNFLITADDTLVACDLETDFASATCKAPELFVDNPTYTFESDVYGIGTLLWTLCYFNYPRLLSFYDTFPPPPPFEAVFFACLDPDVKRRPTLRELRVMAEDIQC
ncbi:cmgc family protein kinase [Moniliophthora roreri MCA 2997]|uniref:Cmgc family protein kinase n=2 Tax=Moniliophthora roreri TaxID=221103 RepID=V2XKR8_MONRO|nr:cmgc family protein kinase [Moniliophthora roreri MCA 2997]KAI3604636.1 cmgc family protein kinase [Moniliophthora roreri]